MKKHTEESKNNKRCLLCVTEGCEDIETVTVFDTIMRAQNIDLVLAKVPMISEMVPTSDLRNELEVRLMQGLRIMCDTLIDNVLNEKFDMIILPGGSGAVRIANLFMQG